MSSPLQPESKRLTSTLLPEMSKKIESCAAEWQGSFISYSQNQEDVVLWRALRHITKGLYIDAGAGWPDKHSVTKAFYIRGWTGINIEPSQVLYSQLQERRPLDINIQAAIGSKEKESVIHLISETGLSTLSDEICKSHERAGFSSTADTIRVVTLQKIFEDYIEEGQEVHFLKIDIEGSEEEAIRGCDWNTFRPWIVVIEATKPLTTLETFDSWEHLLIDNEYIFAYADGLNRFYVSEEHVELLPALRYPPNIFDNYMLSSHVKAIKAAEEANRIADDNRRLMGSLYRILCLKRRMKELFMARHFLGNVKVKESSAITQHAKTSGPKIESIRISLALLPAYLLSTAGRYRKLKSAAVRLTQRAGVYMTAKRFYNRISLPYSPHSHPVLTPDLKPIRETRSLTPNGLRIYHLISESTSSNIKTPLS